MIPKTGIRAVVTGGSQGLGKAFALRIARGGGKVVVADIDEAGGVATAKELDRSGGEGVFTRCDVRDPAQVAGLIPIAEQAIGGVDLVINNAGVAVAGNVGDVSLEDWKWQVDINLWGVIYGCHSFVPHFRKQGRGHVINVASLAGLLSFPGMAPYNVTKFAVVALSEALFGELNGTDVGVTVLCPSFFETNILRSSRNAGLPTGLAEKAMRQSKVQADDVARIALEAAARGRLYALPHTEGKVAWAAKRLSPSLFSSAVKRFGDRLMKGEG